MTEICFLRCFIIPILSAIPARFVGQAVGKPIGNVARHAIAWLFMFLAVGSTYLAMSFWDRPNQFASDLLQGLSVSAIFLGVIFATSIEILFVLMRAAIPFDRTTELTDDIESSATIASIEPNDGNPYSPPKFRLK